MMRSQGRAGRTGKSGIFAAERRSPAGFVRRVATGLALLASEKPCEAPARREAAAARAESFIDLVPVLVGCGGNYARKAVRPPTAGRAVGPGPLVDLPQTQILL